MNKIILITVISIYILFTGCGTTQITHQNISTPTTAPAVVTQDPKTTANQSYQNTPTQTTAPVAVTQAPKTTANQYFNKTGGGSRALKEKQQGNRFFLHAFCLMDNHVHLMLSEGQEDIAKVMKRINVSYVYYFNPKYKRVGHLIKNRHHPWVIFSGRKGGNKTV